MYRWVVLALTLAVMLAACSDTDPVCPDQSCFAARTNAPLVGNIWREEVGMDAEFLSYWNQLTPENAGKWGFVEAERDVLFWDDLDAGVSFAESNQLPFKFHTLFWGAQQPAWLAGLPVAEQREEIDEWARAVAMRYTSFAQIDVVNEPLHAPATYRNALGGDGESGWDWVINAFKLAREVFPDSELLINDFNILRSDQATADYLTIVKLLQDQELVDGIGLQAHFLEDIELPIIARNLDRLAAAGLPIYISELDVDIADDEQQADVLRDLFVLFYEHIAVHGITLWGYRENQHWRPDAHLINADGSKRASMLWLESYLQER